MNTAMPIRIIGINETGHETGNDLMCDGRDLPWLQDTDATQVWDRWTHVYRDVIIVGPDNVPIEAFNLTTQDLSDPANYAALRQKFLDAAN